ncbi:unnamed protein product [Orchesella dallaii]|uniref:Uncharacterized protein n=1 Tax=Orchesella dallaii TaxID=48710 RepID=A0ABP1Q8W1_9HEXA
MRDQGRHEFKGEVIEVKDCLYLLWICILHLRFGICLHLFISKAFFTLHINIAIYIAEGNQKVLLIENTWFIVLYLSHITTSPFSFNLNPTSHQHHVQVQHQIRSHTPKKG